MSALTFAKQKFSDLEILSEAAKSWNFDFRQLDQGKLNAEFLILGTASTQIMNVQLGRKFHQYGTAPNHGHTIAFLDHASTIPDWCGKKVTQDAMPVFAADGSFESVSHPNFRALTVSVSDNCINSISEIYELQRGLERLGDKSIVLSCHRSALDRLRNKISQAFSMAQSSRSLSATDCIQSILESEVPKLILKAANEGIEATEKSVRPRLRARTLRLALEFIEANSEANISLEKLSQFTGASVRTLRYAFHDRFDISPVRYLLAHRLNAVRKQLNSSPSQSVTIQQIAKKNGLHHIGQFSVNYRKMFGERPSDTLKRHSN